MTPRSPQQSTGTGSGLSSSGEVKTWHMVASAVIMLHNLVLLVQCAERNLGAGRHAVLATAPESNAPTPPADASATRSSAPAPPASAPASAPAPPSQPARPSTTSERATTASFHAHQGPIQHAQPWFCSHRWAIAENVTLCSELELSASQVRTTERKLLEAARLFPVYAEEHGIPHVGYWKPLVIYVVTYATINNNDLFPARFPYKVVGRYGAGLMYVTPEMFLKIGTTDLAHEFSHYAVDNGPIMENELNERHARAFEKFVLQHRR